MATEVKILVADSGAFIKGIPLEKLSSYVVTAKEVVSEIRDQNTRRKMQTLPYELHIREPTQAALQHVVNFARKTGDLAYLSAVDIKIMALTYQLTCEQEPVKIAQLKKQPSREEPEKERVSLPGVVGFYNKSKTSSKSDKKSGLDVSTGSTKEEVVDSSYIESLQENIKNLSVKAVSNASITAADATSGSEEMISNDDKSLPSEMSRMGVADSGLDKDNGGDSDDHEEDDDDEGWINPENLEQACVEMGGVLEEEARAVAVGCVTTDFAMQNVLLQMGLTVISSDGLRIKQLRTYAKKCKACFKTTTNTVVQFCPHCGNKTLAKVTVTVGNDGTVSYHFLSKKQFSHKGLRYSLPLPRSGRHANNPVLAPDQKVTSRQKRSRSGHVNPLNPDYIAQSCPFAIKDVTSRGAQISFRGSGRGGKRWNPNEVRQKSSKK